MTDKKTETRTLHIVRNGGAIRITIPASCKVTYGQVQPGKGYGGTYALRIYESADKQIACFVGVDEFYDLAIPIQEQVVDYSNSDELENKDDGTYASSQRVKTRKWQDLNA